MRHAARTWVLTVVMLAAATLAFSHHSTAGQFDLSKKITITGVIAKIDWVNPHIYVFVDGKDESGTTAQWALETLPTAMMRKANLTKEAVAGKAGETVTVIGNPARDGKKSAWINKITYSDGHFIQLAAN